MVHKEKEELLVKVGQLEDELEAASGRGNELKIENEFLRESYEQSKHFLQSYQFK